MKTKENRLELSTFDAIIIMHSIVPNTNLEREYKDKLTAYIEERTAAIDKILATIKTQK